MHVDRLPLRLSLLLLCAPLLAGCPGDRDELGSLIEEADTRSVTVAGSRDEGQVSSGRVNRYVKREGLHIDMPYLGGRELTQIDPDDVAEQLGVEISREEVGEGEVHVVFDKAEVWLLDGIVYRVHSALAHPMDIPTALGVSGFPLSLGTPIDGARNVRWNRQWGTRRIELTRSEEDRRLFTHIDVWEFLPRERR
jgi:hypothetical protein